MMCTSCHKCMDPVYARCELDDRTMFRKMIVCIKCGNKRCPKANDHHNKCTDSNKPGQKGSAYEAANFSKSEK